MDGCSGRPTRANARGSQRPVPKPLRDQSGGGFPDPRPGQERIRIVKITILMGAFLPVPPIMGGAVEKAWFALGQEFASRGHEVVQISRSVSRLPAEEVIAGVKHIRVRGYDTPRSLAWLKFLDLMYSKRAIRRAAPSDIIVTNTFWSPLLWRNPKRGKLYVHVARFPKGQMRFYQIGRAHV